MKKSNKSILLTFVNVYYNGDRIGQGYFTYNERQCVIESNLVDRQGNELPPAFYNLEQISEFLAIENKTIQ